MQLRRRWRAGKAGESQRAPSCHQVGPSLRKGPGHDVGSCHQRGTAVCPGGSCSTCPLAPGHGELAVALAGNPNVGKSSLFNHLTGSRVTTANYAGKTVALSKGRSVAFGKVMTVIDTPGTYSLQGFSEDQIVARHGLTNPKPNVIVVVLDASNLRRNLQLYVEVADLGIPVVVALNLEDEARRLGRIVEPDRLASVLGVPVVVTNGQTGEGIRSLCEAVMQAAVSRPASPVRLSPEAERAIAEVADAVSQKLPSGVGGLGLRATARLLIEGDSETWSLLGDGLAERVRPVVERVKQNLREAGAWPLATERVRAIARLAVDVTRQMRRSGDWLLSLWRLSIDRTWGPLILLGVLGFTFWYMYSVGGILSETLGGLWGDIAMPHIAALGSLLFGSGVLSRVFVWTFGSGIEALLTVGIPYVFTFELLLSLLEDSGYLNAAAYLADSVMRPLGLNGRAIIPMISGTGCNVQAILGTRILASRRERLIASTLIALVPCSARIAVIMGSVGAVSGWAAAAALGVVLILIMGAVGILLNRILRGERQEIMMEMFPLRRPLLKAVLGRTWDKFSGFMREAVPYMLLGSMVVGFLYETETMYHLVRPLKPVVSGILGLPEVVGIALLFAALRKEIALQLSVALAAMVTGNPSATLSSLMDPNQIFIFALVSSLYIPCLATYSALSHELGKRQAFGISIVTIVLAVSVGFLTRVVLAVF
ncbi:MAG TPA: ferrous iron transport protein B [Firmicutes bacterium]|nr:ferrous iron transport protein B [Candidatus Fermentithermobacillaceae bacterium]